MSDDHRRHRRQWPTRVLRVAAYAVAAICIGLAVAVGTARATVLDYGFYRGVLDRGDTYDRVYDEVLLDPAVGPVTDRLLAGLPVPPAAVTSNLRLVLPPPTLRTLLDDQVRSTVRWLRGEGPDELRVRVSLRPVLDNLAGVGQARLGDAVAATPALRAPTSAEFLRQLAAAVGALARGDRPAAIPALGGLNPAAKALRIDEPTLARASGLLLTGVPADARPAVFAQVETALRAGDVEGALAAAGPHLLAPRIGQATLDLTRLSGGPAWDVGLVLDPDLYGDRAAALRQVRAVASLGIGPVAVGALLLGLLAVGVLWVTAPAAGADRVASVGVALIAGATVSAVGLYLGWAGLEGFTAPVGWPRALARLLDDLHDALVRGVVTTWAAALLVPLVAGVLLACHRWLRRLPTLVRRRTRTGTATAWPRPAGAARPAAPLAISAALVTVALATHLSTGHAAGDATHPCNGHLDLCDRGYDEVTHLGTHNAMSSTADKFITPMHDPAILTQLNQGVRALLVDTWRWEQPAQVASRLAEAELSPQMRGLIANVLSRADPPRPGLWFCHAVCRAGAIPLVDTLERLRHWLDANRHEVVTMILQDAITAEETQAAFAHAGLLPYLATPPSGPDQQWPTLGEMILSGQRLVVFAEEADDPTSWYRNFYRYGMETPYAFRTPAEMSCEPNRGGEDKPLFLLNHFITAGGSSRRDANVVNQKQFILDRATRCAAQRGRLPTIVAVDYATIGQALAAVDELNRMR